MALGLSSTLYLLCGCEPPFPTFQVRGGITATQFLQSNGQTMDRQIASVTRSGVLGLVLVNSLLCQLDLMFRLSLPGLLSPPKCYNCFGVDYLSQVPPIDAPLSRCIVGLLGLGHMGLRQQFNAESSGASNNGNRGGGGGRTERCHGAGS